MEMIFCPNCGKLTGYKRALGFGTFFAVLLTAGLWLLAIPFYPKRCITCGLGKSESVPWYQTWRLAAALVAGAVAAAILFHAFSPVPTFRRTITGNIRPAEDSAVPPGDVMGDVVAADEVQKGDLSTPQAQRLKAIESALQQDEETWYRKSEDWHCAELRLTDCRRDFLNAVEYRPVVLGTGGREGLVVEVELQDFGCGSHGCQIFVLRKIANGYQKVLRELGGLHSVTVTGTATDGYYDLVVEGGTVAYPEQTKYIWDGLKYSQR